MGPEVKRAALSVAVVAALGAAMDEAAAAKVTVGFGTSLAVPTKSHSGLADPSSTSPATLTNNPSGLGMYSTWGTGAQSQTPQSGGLGIYDTTWSSSIPATQVATPSTIVVNKTYVYQWSDGSSYGGSTNGLPGGGTCPDQDDCAPGMWPPDTGPGNGGQVP